MNAPTTSRRPIRVILDTWGEWPLHPNIASILSNVEFVQMSPPQYRGQKPNPHGAWCAWHLLSQEAQPVTCAMIQMLGPNGGGDNTTDAWMFGALRSLDLKIGDIVSCSWGAMGEGGFTPAWCDRFFEACGGADIYFAASNSGRGTRAFPQWNIRARPGVFIVGAIDRFGFRAKFSSAWEDAGAEYVTLAGLGDGGLALDPFTGQIQAWSGTSQACPNVAGIFAARRLFGAAVIPYARAYVLDDEDRDGIPNGIHPSFAAQVAAGKFHPEVGLGVVEGLRQVNMLATGRGLGNWPSSVQGVALTMSGAEDIPPIDVVR